MLQCSSICGSTQTSAFDLIFVLPPPALPQVESSKAYKLKRGLAELGVKEITAADIVQQHVLPLFRHHKQQLAQEQQSTVQEGTLQQLKAALTFVALSGLWQVRNAQFKCMPRSYHVPTS